MRIEELLRFGEIEADWLRYYGHIDTRKSDKLNDSKFYDRIKPIGYTKRQSPLYSRCSMVCITSDKPVLLSKPEDIWVTSGPRNHQKNIYTPLEYLLTKNINREIFNNIIKGKKNEQ